MIALRIAAWNVNGLAPNKREVELLMDEHKLDILLISEAHCTTRSSIKFKEYQCYCTYHPDGTGHAGTALIVKNSIKHHEMPSYKTNHIQATTVAVQDETGYLNVSAVYCPPKHIINEGMFTNFFQSLGNRYIAGGDWNAKHVYWASRLTTTRGRQLKRSVDSNNLTVISSAEPTYWPTDCNKTPDLLDFFITKGVSNIYLKAESCYDSSSDHTPVLLTISTKIIEYEQPETLYNKNTDWNSFRDYIEKNIKNNVALKTPDDIEDATKYLTALIQKACWISTPDVKNNDKIANYPLQIKMAILEKRRLRRVWHQSRLREDKTKFNKAIQDLKQMIQDWDDNTLTSQLESLTANDSTSHSLWKFTKNYDRPQTTKPPLKSNTGWARTSKEKADLFGEHLAAVFKPNDPAQNEAEKEVPLILNQDYQMSLPPKSVSVREVWKVVTQLKDKKAPGFDLITKEVIKQLPKKAIVFLTTLYNGILRVQYFPQLWKVSQIILIHKAGKPPSDVRSYRPVSLLPILSKIFEKLLLRRILPLLEENNSIPNHQFGFRQQHSTVEQVHRVYEKIRKTLEEKQYCSAAFLDIQQAFDRVWHDGLLCKIKTCLPHSYYRILESYLRERIFQVKERDATSDFHEIHAGVPQGSVLGPVLYTIFTADLPEVEKITTATFADDTAILASSENPVAATEILQQGLDKITTWLQKWRIKASASKSVQVTFTLRKGNCPSVQLENSTLPHQNSVRYLGLYLDRRLTWHEHIKKKRDQLNIKFKGLLWLLGRNSKLSIDNKLLIYKVVLKPMWMYGIQLWGSACNSSITCLQRMQNSILRTICNAPWFTTVAELHEHAEIATVKEEVQTVTKRYRERLKSHPNTLAMQLTMRSYVKRLKRNDIIL